MKIDLIVLNWNYKRYLGNIISSISNQKYKNLRVIFCDNNSNDNSVSLAIELFDYYKIEVLMLARKENYSVSENLNYAVNQSKSEWFMIISADDWLLPDAIINRVKYIENNPGVDFVTASLKNYIQETDKFEDVPDLKYLLHDNAFDNMFLNNFLAAPGAMYKSSKFIEYGRFNEKLKYEDWPFWLNAIENKAKIHILHDHQIVYRMHSKSTSYYPTFDLVKNQLEIVDLYKNHKLYNKVKKIRKYSALIFATNKQNGLSFKDKLKYFKEFYFFDVRLVKAFIRLLKNSI